jgi:hypothetical protein
MAQRMRTTFRTAVWISLFASVTAAKNVHSAGASANASASATIVSPANVSASASRAYNQLWLSNSTGGLTIRIPGVLERVEWPASARAWTLRNNNQESTKVSNDDRVTLYWVNDGTLIGDQGTSFAFTRASYPDGMVMAVLAYN